MTLPDTSPCPNFWCGREDRGFDVVWAVGPHTGPLRRSIAGLKYRNETWQAPILGALLARWLLTNAPCFEDVDLIVGVPGTPGRDHTQRILQHTGPVADLWPVDTGHDLLTKRAGTRAMVGTPSSELRRLWAAGELRPTLQIGDATQLRDSRILVIDDVFTDGSTLREVALALRSAGARAVSGLVLARQPLVPSTGVVHNHWYDGR